MYTPSMISAASVAAALHGLGWTAKSMALPDLLLTLQRILSIEKVRIANTNIYTRQTINFKAFVMTRLKE